LISSKLIDFGIEIALTTSLYNGQGLQPP